VKDARSDIPERDHAVRSCVVPCAGCGRFTELSMGPAGAPLPAEATCRACGARRPLDFAGHVGADARLDGCPVCDYHTLCIQKDVNARLFVVAIAVTFAILLVSGLSIPWMVAVLLLVTLLDWLLLRLVVKRLLICYRCKAQFRGFPPGVRCRPFDLATWEAHDAPAGPAS
jgi:hypothetical protein